MNEVSNNDRIILACTVNVGSSSLLVLANKILYKNYNFPSIALNCLHFLVTFVGLIILKYFRIFEPKKLPIIAMVPLSLTFCSYMVFTKLPNLNTSITNFMIRILTLPVVMIILFLYLNKTYSFRVLTILVRYYF